MDNLEREIQENIEKIEEMNRLEKVEIESILNPNMNMIRNKLANLVLQGKLDEFIQQEFEQDLEWGDTYINYFLNIVRNKKEK